MKIIKQIKKIYMLLSDKNEIQLKQPNFFISSVSWTIISLSSLGLIISYFAKIDEVIIAPGDLESINSITDIYSPVEGVIEEILVSEGDFVYSGQSLIKLDSDLALANEKALINSIEIQKNKLSYQLKLLRSEEKSLRYSFKTQKSISEKYKTLYEQGAISQVAFLDKKDQVQKIFSKIEQIENKIKKEKETTKQNINELNTKLLSAQELKRFKIIQSPIDGKVFDLRPKSQGYIIKKSDNLPIMRIVPEDSLVGKIFIPNSKIAFIEIGQNVDLRIDTYPFTEFGSVKGNIDSIGTEVKQFSSNTKESYFPAVVSLETQYIEKNKKKYPLLSGQTVNGNIILREKRIITLLTDVFNQLFDSLRSIRN